MTSFPQRRILLSRNYASWYTSPLTIPCRRLHRTVDCRSDNGAIVPDSLEKTLDAHRDANRASLIRRVYTGDVSPVRKVPSTVRSGSRPSRPQSHTTSHGESLKPLPPSAESITAASITSAPTQGTSLSFGALRSPRLRAVWLKQLEHPNKTQFFQDGGSQLSAEIRALGDYIMPTAVEEEQAQQILAEISQLLEGVVSHPLQWSGARSLGLGTTLSAMPIRLLVPDPSRSGQVREPSPTRPYMVSQYADLLREVENELRRHPSYVVLRHTSANVKSNQAGILDVRHRETRLRLSFHCGEKYDNLYEHIKNWQAEYPSFRYLFVASRLILQSNILYGKTGAGITHPALAVLLANFLKMSHGRFLGNNDLGEQLLAFLHKFGLEVDLQKSGVAADPPAIFDRRMIRRAYQEHGAKANWPVHLRGQFSLLNRRQTALERGNLALAQRLCVQDPTNYLEDLGTPCLHTAFVQMTFRDAYQVLRTRLAEWSGGRVTPTRNLLGSVIRTPFDKTEQMRKLLASRKELSPHRSN
ncbi:hypothetical protein BO86DRAFT_388207 [Aspergillus japonicus CBS 114.51]|uniref:Uncharacterized protein n=2 Tax=Aspergillus TaxID=5052 RepID=A0A2V5IAY5_ASPV1|nr:hypothetical protein BO86DRAFT_388207 [Aspergillus japonicus CBS 114.51]PYI21177.1 hypothetical protein BO99DRAFT_87803 [Aspergillus violaceofuscus CBS 115571]RAH83003.1 hypothetical protein BO86DRAFT_388207 [Aspergillus japonicus CBS 114.51]